MAWTYALDNATPAGSDAPSTIDDQIRLVKTAIQERLNASDIYWPLTGTAVISTDAGKHRKVTAQAVLAVKPTLLTGEAALYTKTVSGVSEWFWEDSAGTEHQLTSGGLVNIAETDIAGILLDEDDMNSNSATSIVSQQSLVVYTAAQIAAKAGMVPAVTGAGTGYAGEESITLPNGCIMKWGTITTGIPAASTLSTLTFPVAFPNACESVNYKCNNYQAIGQANNTIESISTTTFTYKHGNSAKPTSIYWQAIGY